MKNTVVIEGVEELAKFVATLIQSSTVGFSTAPMVGAEKPQTYLVTFNGGY
jgi:hypothetical protein